jgi:nitrous oxidase accessory protein NosD
MKIFPVIPRIAPLLLICLLWISCKKDDNLNSTLPASKSGISSISDTTSLTPQTNATTPSQSNPVVLTSQSNKVINMLDIQGNGSVCIALSGCDNITIQNCVLHNSTKDAITLYNCKNVKIVNCYIYKVSAGVYANQSTAITVSNNQFLNMQGPYPGGNYVQFDNVNGAGNIINGNKCENVAGQAGDAYDGISLYESNGTADSPILVSGNWLRGGGPNTFSAGIQLSDNGGSYQIAENNILVNPGSVGIDVASGTNIQVINNKIYSQESSFANVGIDFWNEYATTCAMNTVSGNQVKWTSHLSKENDYWDGKNCGPAIGLETNIWNATIDESILPAVMITGLVKN